VLRQVSLEMFFSSALRDDISHIQPLAFYILGMRPSLEVFECDTVIDLEREIERDKLNMVFAFYIQRRIEHRHLLLDE